MSTEKGSWTAEEVRKIASDENTSEQSLRSFLAMAANTIEIQATRIRSLMREVEKIKGGKQCH